MGLYRKFVGSTRKPEGLLGRLMVAGMNSGHAALADWGCQNLEEESLSMILDIGCGGGANVKRFLQRCSKAHVTGVDYSAVSVEKAGKLNAAAVKYSKIIDGMQLYTPEQLKALLEEAGFTEVKLRQASDKPWIAVLGRKPKKGKAGAK